MEYLNLVNIKKTYNKKSKSRVEALKGINLEIKKNELVAIIGKSGSGKSTLLHILGALDYPTEGEYFIDSVNVSNMKSNELAELRNQKIGFVLQEFGLILNKSVYENIAVPLYFSNKVKMSEIKNKVLKVLEQVGLSEKVNSMVAELSGGQKQRVAIARAIIMNPEIILADEPTGALDEATSKEIVDLLKSLNSQGRTVIIVTHDVRVAEACNRTIRITDGCMA